MTDRSQDSWHLAQAVLAYLRPRWLETVLVVGLAALLEGVGILVLLPAAEVIFAGTTQMGAGEATGLTQKASQWLALQGADTTIEQLGALGTVFLSIVLLRALILQRRDVLLAELSEGFVDDRRKRLFRKLARAPWPLLKQHRRSHLLDTMTNNIGRLSYAMSFLTTGVITLALALALVATAFVVSTTLGLALVAILMLGTFAALLWSRRSHASGLRLTLANRDVMDESIRFLDGLKAAKATRAEEALARRYDRQVDETRAIQIAFIRQQGTLRNVVQILAATGAFAVLMVGYGLVGLGGAELLVMAAIILRLAPTLITAFNGIQSIAYALPAFSGLRELERQLGDGSAGRHCVRSATGSAEGMSGTLILDGVVVTPPGVPGAPLLQVGRIAIPPGSIVHVEGASGAGKSTLIELLAALQMPDRGDVRCGDVLLEDATQERWQANVSFAPQEAFLFDAPLRENLCWPNLSVSDDELWHALTRAQADDLVRSLPGGLDEPLLDGGARLSGGERQRLCLARAFLRPAYLLLLDEATSALDIDLERAVLQRLRLDRREGITVLAAHSRQAAAIADLTIRIESGRAQIANIAAFTDPVREG